MTTRRPPTRAISPSTAGAALRKQRKSLSKTCAVCGSSYQTIQTYSSYCSDACKSKGWRNRKEAAKENTDAPA
jgi:predicted nucleic acid-binding Zn ribbon protein